MQKAERRQRGKGLLGWKQLKRSGTWSGGGLRLWSSSLLSEYEP